MSGSPLLEAANVSASRFFEDDQPRRVVDNVSLTVAEGEVLAIVGPSGSGKSTLLRLFNRLLEQDSGRILFAGKSVAESDPPALRAQLPLVPQKPFLFKGTVADNLNASARLRHTAPPDLGSDEAKAILSLCQVAEEWLPRDGSRLSIGQQQRVCLARALFGPCRGLLLDEPTSALDRPTAEQLAKTFRQLARERELAMIIVTHDLRVAEICADRVAILIDGKVVEEGKASRVMNDPQHEQARAFVVAGPLDDEGENQ
jgi:putative ABC transport system ATP-binding protein